MLACHLSPILSSLFFIESWDRCQPSPLTLQRRESYPKPPAFTVTNTCVCLCLDPSYFERAAALFIFRHPHSACCAYSKTFSDYQQHVLDLHENIQIFFLLIPHCCEHPVTYCYSSRLKHIAIFMNHSFVCETHQWSVPPRDTIFLEKRFFFLDCFTDYLCNSLLKFFSVVYQRKTLIFHFKTFYILNHATYMIFSADDAAWLCRGLGKWWGRTMPLQIKQCCVIKKNSIQSLFRNLINNKKWDSSAHKTCWRRYDRADPLMIFFRSWPTNLFLLLICPFIF